MSPFITADVLALLLAEREKQKMIGYQPEHDDHHSLGDFATLIESRVRGVKHKWERFGWNPDGSHLLVEIAAIAIAALESAGRRGYLATEVEPI